MKDFGPFWARVQGFLIEGFGTERVHSEKKGIRLSFDLADAWQLQQLNQLGNLAVDQKLFFPSQPCGDMKVEVFIPIATDVQKMLPIAYGMAVRSDKKATGETHRPITPYEPEHILQEMTGVPWKHVFGSPYCAHVVEAVLPEGEGDSEEKKVKRVKREFGIGYVLRKEGSISLDVKNWLHHQVAVEEKNHMPPRVMVPGDWTKQEGLRRAEMRKNDGQSLQSVFK